MSKSDAANESQRPFDGAEKDGSRWVSSARNRARRANGREAATVPAPAAPLGELGCAPPCAGFAKVLESPSRSCRPIAPGSLAAAPGHRGLSARRSIGPLLY